MKAPNKRKRPKHTTKPSKYKEFTWYQRTKKISNVLWGWHNDVLPKYKYRSFK